MIFYDYLSSAMGTSKKDLSRYFNDERYGDVKIRGGQNIIYCSKVLLASQSDTFQKMFDAGKDTISLSHLSSNYQILKSCLLTFYGVLPHITIINFRTIFLFAVQYEISNLIQKCMLWIETSYQTILADQTVPFHFFIDLFNAEPNKMAKYLVFWVDYSRQNSIDLQKNINLIDTSLSMMRERNFDGYRKLVSSLNLSGVKSTYYTSEQF